MFTRVQLFKLRLGFLRASGFKVLFSVFAVLKVSGAALMILMFYHRKPPARSPPQRRSRRRCAWFAIGLSREGVHLGKVPREP